MFRAIHNLSDNADSIHKCELLTARQLDASIRSHNCEVSIQSGGCHARAENIEDEN